MVQFPSSWNILDLRSEMFKLSHSIYNRRLRNTVTSYLYIYIVTQKIIFVFLCLHLRFEMCPLSHRFGVTWLYKPYLNNMLCKTKHFNFIRNQGMWFVAYLKILRNTQIICKLLKSILKSISFNILYFNNTASYEDGSWVSRLYFIQPLNAFFL